MYHCILQIYCLISLPFILLFQYLYVNCLQPSTLKTENRLDCSVNTNLSSNNMQLKYLFITSKNHPTKPRGGITQGSNQDSF